jgi:uncharacterized Tic20 family protein
MTDGKKNSVNWAMVCHLGGLATYIGIPLGNILVPLLVWLVKRKKDSRVDEAGREALNFNISFTIYGVVAGLACYIFIGYVALPLVLVTHVVLVVQAILKANKGESVHYPFTLRFIS